MLSRRNIRIKVMQTLYAHEQDPEKTLERLEKSMLENINGFYRAYLYNFFLLCKTAEYAVTDVQIRSSKHIQSEGDKILSVQLFHNPVIQHLVVNENLYHEMRREKMDHRIDEDYYRRFFYELRSTNEYAAYSRKENPLLPEDKEIVTFLYRKILCSNELYQQHLEDLFPTWHDDQEAIYFAVMNTLQTISPDQKQFIANRNKDLKEGKDFGLNLFRKVIYNEADLTTLITPFLQNWEEERVALLDMIVMKLALTEILFFPEIPVKVSINEYIELAKLYSTPKSGEFINGVLDAIRKKLKEEGKIEKAGRGMKEE